MNIDLYLIASGLASMLVGGGIFVGGLMLGWRMGRDSVQKPMFEYSSAKDDTGKQDVVVAEEDPWSQAALRSEELM